MNTARVRRVRKSLDWLKRTPFHPKWLLQPSKRKIRALRGIESGIVLDIGCSDRWAGRHLHPSVRYIGLDYPATSTDLYGTIPDVYGDARALPFDSETFDAVLLFDVLEHLEAPAAALSEIARVLRHDGALFIAVPFLYPMHDEPYDFQRLTAYGLERDLKKAGFSNIDVSPELGPVESAGLLTCIALTAVVIKSASERHFSIVFAPLIAVAIPLINVLSWAVGKIFPVWHAMPAIYWVTVRK